MSQSPFRRHALWWATGALLSAGGAVAVVALVTLPAPAAVAAEGAPGQQGQNPPVRVTTVQARQQDVPV